ITKSAGVAIAVVENGNIVYCAQTGITSHDPELQCQSNVFKDSIGKGNILELRGANSDSQLGAICLPLGVKSLIIFPFQVSNELVGGIQLAYQETCRLERADKVALKLIGEALAIAINDSLSRNITPVTQHQQAAAELGQLSSNTGETVGKWKSLLKRRRNQLRQEDLADDSRSA